MNFKLWFEEQQLTDDDAPRQENEPDFTWPYVLKAWRIANRVAQEHNQPKPKTFLGSGNYATIFTCDRPNIIIRVANDADEWNSCDKKMALPQIQKTGGVNKVFGMFKDEKSGYMVTYKEKLDTNWEKAFANVMVDLTALKDMGYTELPPKMKQNGFKEIPDKMSFVDVFVRGILATAGQQIGDHKVLTFLRTLGIRQLNNLLDAAAQGITLRDLHAGNVALDSQGNLVIIDC